jgi:glucose-6-phosphate isomerase, archaeal
MDGWEGELPPPAVRTIEEMRPVLADPACACSGPLYYMYRDLARSDNDRRWLRQNQLRYDITAIPPHVLCGEYVKTKGHYHPENAEGTGYPEIYEVLEGEAYYLLQSRQLDDIVLISASRGDVVVIPPEYGHISINPSSSSLVMANIVSTAFESEYGEYETRHGAGYYVMSDGNFRKNPHYPSLPPVRRMGARCGKGTHRFCEGPLYSLIGHDTALAFLNHPERYRAIFSVLLKD